MCIWGCADLSGWGSAEKPLGPLPAPGRPHTASLGPQGCVSTSCRAERLCLLLWEQQSAEKHVCSRVPQREVSRWHSQHCVWP